MTIDDYDRIEYLNLHLKALSQAIDASCNVKAYTVWSLIDNFEWMRGYTERFGIYAINFTDPERQRIPKKSVALFKDLMQNINFVWGAASASYQIEGAWNVDGRIPSIWDTASHKNNSSVVDGSTVMMPHFKTYRFSIAWPRVLTKTNQVNQAGIDYYSKLIDRLKEEEIKPMVTMYHWDLPQYLQDLGGWTNPAILGRYANPIYSVDDYPRVMREAIDQRVKMKGEDADSDSEIHSFHDDSWKRSASSWLVSVPEGLYHLLLWIKDHYNNPLVYITENGWSDLPMTTEDDGRVEYLREHLATMSRAITDGCRVEAYTVWSLTDNFEWMRGYTERFGIYAINFTDPERKRIPKNSVDLMKQVVRDNFVEVEKD
ncbi:hypothetical protein PVAND_001438 [Polypedilum vanderplanki]|uniref:Beta-glucosidase n=1 Tax=Polypedilum vanderplanki TaxID=319348 RepID=A0A9J6BNF4_POLVA|nr:hypothetical protein PVAND_001438 [Polypedilum vanderplanki]